MNYDLITLVSRLRQVEDMEQLEEVKALAESFMRREKNYALLTLLAVGEELGEEEISGPLNRMTSHLRSIEKLKKAAGGEEIFSAGKK